MERDSGSDVDSKGLLTPRPILHNYNAAVSRNTSLGDETIKGAESVLHHSLPTRGVDIGSSPCAVSPGRLSLDAMYMVIEAGEVRAVPRRITRAHMDSMFQYRLATDARSGSYNAEAGDLVVAASLSVVLALYGHWRIGQVRGIAALHR
ncbi:hypothetical protein C2E23DRAFT_877865, partial [Lenzites betulinus]